MIKKLFLILGFAGLACAQQRETVYQQLLNGATTISQGSQYLVSNNVGQTFHTFSIISRSIKGTTTNCAVDPYYAFNIASEIDSSYDGTNFFPVANVRIASQVGSATQTSTKFYRVGGAYPYIRLQINAIPTNLPTNCVLDINYTGSLTAPSISDANTPEGVVSSAINSSCLIVPLAGTVLHTTQPAFILVNLLGIQFSPASAATQNISLITNAETGCATGPNGSNFYYFNLINGYSNGLTPDFTNFAPFGYVNAYLLSSSQYLQVGITTSAVVANTSFTLWYVDAS